MLVHSQVNAVAFDKTGTLTKGTVVVSDFLFCPFPRDAASSSFVPLNAQAAESALLSGGAAGGGSVEFWKSALKVLHLLHLAEKRSSHPLAKGIATFCREHIEDIRKQADAAVCNDEKLHDATEEDVHFQVQPGMGVIMSSADSAAGDNSGNNSSSNSSCCKQKSELQVLVGNLNLLEMHGVVIPTHATSTAASYRAGGKVAVFMAINGTLRVIMGVADAIREEAPHVVATLQRQGIHCYMITGDEPATALAIAKIVGE